MRFCRIRLEQLNSDDPSPLVIDLPLGTDDKTTSKIPQPGWWGIPKGNNWCRPVIFKPDGLIDFGGDPEDSHEERYSKMQIFDRVFQIGERFYMEDLEDRGVHEFVVREVIELRHEPNS